MKKQAENGLADNVKLRLVEKQEGLCAHCGDPFLLSDKIETHHIIPKRMGGAEKLNNYQLLHHTCHKQVEWQNKQKAKNLLRE